MQVFCAGQGLVLYANRLERGHFVWPATKDGAVSWTPVNASTKLLPSLPDDVAALQAMVLAQRTELAAARAGLIEQRFEIEALKTRLSKLLRLSFGTSSEKLRAQVEQLELRLGDIDELLAEIGSDASASNEAASGVQGGAKPGHWSVGFVLTRAE